MKKKLLLVCIAFAVAFLLSACDRSDPKLSGVGKKIEVQCETQFNLEDYLNENLKIKDETDDGMKEYNLKDLEYEISCDEAVYNAKTGKINTGDFGKYDVELTVKDESGNKTKKAIKLILNPLEIQKGYYVYKNDSESETYDLQGYCSYKNTSKQNINIKSVFVSYFDKDNITVCESEDPLYTAPYVKPGEMGFVYEDYAGSEAVIKAPEDIHEIKIDIKYEKAADKNKRALQVGEIEIFKGYEYNVSGFAGTTIITNPFNKKVNEYLLLVGMFDKDGKLIGVMDGMMDATSIAAKGKAKGTAVWLPDSKDRCDKTVMLKGAAHAYEFAGEEY